jgi:hypothetical protein
MPALKELSPEPVEAYPDLVEGGEGISKGAIENAT